jgi:hypothetical protein
MFLDSFAFRPPLCGGIFSFCEKYAIPAREFIANTGIIVEYSREFLLKIDKFFRVYISVINCNHSVL